MGVEQNKRALAQAVEAFNSDDKERYLEVYAPGAVFHGYPPDMQPDLPGASEFYRSVWRAFPDGELVLHDVIAEGDRVACRYSLTATHQGEFMGAAPTGRRVVLEGQTILRFDENARCVERWQSLDVLGMMVQLGLMPAPAEAAA